MRLTRIAKYYLNFFLGLGIHSCKLFREQQLLRTTSASCGRIFLFFREGGGICFHGVEGTSAALTDMILNVNSLSAWARGYRSRLGTGHGVSCVQPHLGSAWASGASLILSHERTVLHWLPTLAGLRRRAHGESPINSPSCCYASVYAIPKKGPHFTSLGNAFCGF